MGVIFIDSLPLSNSQKLQYVNEAKYRYKQIIKEFSTKKTFDHIVYCEYSLEMCHAILEILTNQLIVYRKIVFPNEFRKIWHYCLYCQTKKFFSRLKKIDKFSNTDTQLIELFKCESCEFVDYEWDLIDTIKQPYRSAMNCPKPYEDEMKIGHNVFTKIWYYKLIKINYDDFIIKINEKFMCPICRKVLSQNHAQRHFNSIFKNNNWPCMKYYKLEQ